MRKLGPILVLFGVVTICSGLLRSTSPAPSEALEPWTWEVLVCPEGRFSAEFPGTPAEGSIDQPTPAGELRIHRFSLSKGGGKMEFAASYRSYSAAMQTAGIVPTLDAAADATASAPGHSLIRKTALSVAGHEGRELLFDAGEEFRVRMRIAVIDGTMYTIMVVRPKDWADSPDQTRFLDSFRRVPP